MQTDAFKFTVNFNSRNHANSILRPQLHRFCDTGYIVMIRNRQGFHTVFLSHGNDFSWCVIRIRADDRMNMIV